MRGCGDDDILYRMLRLLLMMLLAAMIPPLTGCGDSQPDPATDADPDQDVLHIYIPANRIDPDIPTQYQRVTGTRVVVTDDPAAHVDLRIVSGHSVPALVADNDIQPLNHDNLPNLGNLGPPFDNPPYDPGNTHSIPYRWESIGLLYRADIVGEIQPTWNHLFNPPTTSPPFTVLLDDNVLLAIARIHLQAADETDRPVDLQQVAAAVTQLRESPRYRDDSADAAIMLAGSAAAHRAMNDKPSLRFVIPREGSVIRVGVMVIPANADRPGEAHRFINYLLDPQIGAQLADESGAATPNDAARRYIRPPDRADPTLYPPPDVMNQLQFLGNE